jgi:hypothetical protein
MNKKILFPLVLIVLVSCEEVIKVDVKDNTPSIVAEGAIYNDSLCAVKITTTSDYYSTQHSAYIEDAVVVIKKDDQTTEVLNYEGNGYYVGKTLIGEECGNYQIEIIYNDQTYVATSYMPAKTEIYSIVPIKNKRKGKKSNSYKLQIKWKDNPQTKEYYMIKYVVNGKPLEDRYRILPDIIAVGDTITFSSMLVSFQSKDHIDVHVYSIDKSVFTYFKQLNDVLGVSLGISASPGNPLSNFNNGAMGYFAALTYVTKSIDIP